MLKQSENKGTKPGKLDDFERQYADLDRPGHVRVGFWPQPSGIVNELAKRGYRDDLGRPLARFLPIPLTPDPAVISGSETPSELRAELDAAEEARAAWMRRRGELFETSLQATNRWQLAARQQNAKAYDSALAEELRVAEQLRDTAAEEPLLVRRIAKAHDAIRRWQYVERLRRTEAAAGR